jgi:putative NADPH-quinone reductase
VKLRSNRTNPKKKIGRTRAARPIPKKGGSAARVERFDVLEHSYPVYYIHLPFNVKCVRDNVGTNGHFAISLEFSAHKMVQ